METAFLRRTGASPTWAVAARALAYGGNVARTQEAERTRQAAKESRDAASE